MLERPAHSAFVPFVPPPALAHRESQPNASVAVDTIIDTVPSEHERALPIEVLSEQPAEQTSEEEVVSAVEDFEPPSAPAPVVQACRHETIIRSEAIRLAAIACGRALRRAALIHPQVIAAFVDDAIEAAGRAAEATIATSQDVEEFGEVAVGFSEPDIRIAADIETRAALLVRAAASA